jgi:hypothetical protein
MSENGVESGKPLELPGASAPSTTAGSALVPDMTPEMVEKIVGSCGFKAATATIMGAIVVVVRFVRSGR